VDSEVRGEEVEKYTRFLSSTTLTTLVQNGLSHGLETDGMGKQHGPKSKGFALRWAEWLSFAVTLLSKSLFFQRLTLILSFRILSLSSSSLTEATEIVEAIELAVQILLPFYRSCGSCHSSLHLKASHFRLHLSTGTGDRPFLQTLKLQENSASSSAVACLQNPEADAEDEDASLPTSRTLLLKSEKLSGSNLKESWLGKKKIERERPKKTDAGVSIVRGKRLLECMRYLSPDQSPVFDHK